MRYEFVLTEAPSVSALAAFPELTTATELPPVRAVLYGEVQDRPHLRGLLDRFEDLALTVVEMRRLPD